MIAGSRIPTLIAGAVLLVAGRRLYWLLVGLVGFVVGFALVAEYLEASWWLTVVGGLLAGSLAAALAVLFQKVVIAIAGFLAGGLVVLWWADQLGWGEPWWVWALAVVAGCLGAWLVRTAFEVGLIVVSSVLGATLVLAGLARPADELSPVFIALVAAGMLVQFVSTRRRRKA